ncbi:MAG: DNA-binding response regulator [Firmicutes bacterium CAG:24053_14]|jgi:two-component system alkaline phosphatase synthesis response regulator PhoP|nr:MAG: DNA-binding response regulator [Firmicutes bacterium CAG:24053_14]
MIFCVEDDAGIRDLMIYTLSASGFRAVGFENAREFYAALADDTPELIMLDIMLPGEDGISILKRLKADARTADIPVIMATAKGNEYDKVIGLDLGADDYLAKPFGMMEMASRVRAVLRRSGRAAEKQQLIRVGGLEMNLGEHIVTADGIRVQLTLKEFELLRTFMTSPGRAFTREQLLSSVWSEDFLGETRTVDVHVGTLRQKLGACGKYIRTVRGVGYKLEV